MRAHWHSMHGGVSRNHGNLRESIFCMRQNVTRRVVSRVHKHTHTHARTSVDGMLFIAVSKIYNWIRAYTHANGDAAVAVAILLSK